MSWTNVQGPKDKGTATRRASLWKMDRTYLNTDRACQELRRGGMVMLRLANGAACIRQAAELTGDGHREHLQRIAGSGALLVLTSSRLEALGHALPSEFCGASLPVHNLDHIGIGHLAIQSATAQVARQSSRL